MEQKVTLPESGEYAVGSIFFPKDETLKEKCRQICNDIAASRQHSLLAWRVVSVNNRNLGAAALNTEPVVEQWFLKLNEEMTIEVETEVFIHASNAQEKAWFLAFYSSSTDRSDFERGRH